MANNHCPEGWKLVRLDDLGEVNRGRSRHRPRYAKHLYGGPYPFIQTGDIKASGGRITTYHQTYSEAGLAQSRIWPTGTMCITIAANIAETAVLQFPACFPDSIIGFIPNESKCDLYFVEYMFRYLRRRIQNEAIGTVQDNINLGTLDRIRFFLPPLPEQKAIAQILGALDDKIELNNRMNATIEQIGQAMFKRWFVDFEFPDEKGKPYKSSGGEMVDSELGEIPKGWEVKPLDKIADFLNGLALQKYPPRGEEYLPVIKIRELRQGVTESSDKASPDIDRQFIVEDGDILFSWSGSLELAIWCGGKGALNQHLFKVTSNDYPKWLYYYWIKEHLGTFQRIAAGKATTMGHIQRHHLSETLTVVPPVKLLPNLSRIMAPLIDTYIKNGVESQILIRIRDSLLPKLMSGKIRVEVERVA